VENRIQRDLDSAFLIKI